VVPPDSLVGSKSLKLDILGQNVGITASNLSANMDAYDGVVMRVKSGGPADVLYFVTNLNGQNIAAHNIRLVYMNGTITGTGMTGTSFTLKSDFDGYVFYPFGDLKAAIKAGGGGGFNSIQFGFYSATAGTSISADQISLYTGAQADYLKVIEEIDPGAIIDLDNISVANPDAVAQVLFDLENGNDPFENQITVYNQTIPEATAPEIVSGTSGLVGNNSLKINMVIPVNPYDGIKLTTSKYVNYQGYSGIVVRIKTDSKTLFNNFSIILSGIDANDIAYNGTLSSRWFCIDKDGVVGSPFVSVDGGNFLPPDFDGYAFFPFDSYISSTNPVYRPLPVQSECDRIKSAKTYNVGIKTQIPYVSSDGKDRYAKWLPYSYIIDQIAFYFATDKNGYQAVIDKLEPDSSIIVKTMEEYYGMNSSIQPIAYENPYTGPSQDTLNLTRTLLLTDFEDGNARFENNNGCTASIVGLPNNLVGGKSVKLEILGQNVGITASNLSANMDDYDGVVVRVKSIGPADVLYFVTNLNGQNIAAENIKLVSMNRTMTGTGTTGTSFTLKNDFDGYVFYPFGDLKAAIKAAGGGGFNSVQFGFYSASAGTVIFTDQISLYIGAEADYLNIADEITKKPAYISLTANSIITDTGEYLSYTGVAKSANDFLDNFRDSYYMTVSLYEANTTVGTGASVALEVNNIVIETKTVMVKGDVSGDGQINIADLAEVKKHLLKINVLVGAFQTAGDISGGSSITISDLLALKKLLLI
jgi:hypothetical protein